MSLTAINYNVVINRNLGDRGVLILPFVLSRRSVIATPLNIVYIGYCLGFDLCSGFTQYRSVMMTLMPKHFFMFDDEVADRLYAPLSMYLVLILLIISPNKSRNALQVVLYTTPCMPGMFVTYRRKCHRKTFRESLNILV